MPKYFKILLNRLQIIFYSKNTFIFRYIFILILILIANFTTYITKLADIKKAYINKTYQKNQIENYLY
jgi:preprotein translocase subunit SecG